MQCIYMYKKVHTPLLLFKSTGCPLLPGLWKQLRRQRRKTHVHTSGGSKNGAMGGGGGRLVGGAAGGGVPPRGGAPVAFTFFASNPAKN